MKLEGESGYGNTNRRECIGSDLQERDDVRPEFHFLGDMPAGSDWAVPVSGLVTQGKRT